MSSIVKAVNRAYGRLETRPIWKVRGISLVLVLASGTVLAGMLLLIVLGGKLGDAIAAKAGFGDAFTWLWNLARWPLAFVVILLLFALIYYLAPNVEQRSWKWITPGSLVGARRLAGSLGPLRAVHVVLGLVLEDVRRARRRDRAPAVAQLQRLGRALRRRAELGARPAGRHPGRGRAPRPGSSSPLAELQTRPSSP